MADGVFLCYKDANGYRGYIPPHTPYIIKQISTNKYWLEADAVAAVIVTGPEDDDGRTYDEVLGFVSKEEKALKWLTHGDNSQFIGANNC